MLVVAHAAANNDAMLVLLPFLPALIGLLFIRIALRDRSGSRQSSLRTLPTAKEQPLRYVNVALASHRRRRATAVADADGPKRAPAYRSGRPQLRRVR